MLLLLLKDFILSYKDVQGITFRVSLNELLPRSHVGTIASHWPFGKHIIVSFPCNWKPFLQEKLT